MNNVKVFLKEHSNEVRRAVKIGSIAVLSCGMYTIGYSMCLRNFETGLEMLCLKNPKLKEDIIATIQAIEETE